MQTTSLGQTGLLVSRLCFGTGTNGWSGRSDQTALGLDGLADLLRFAYDQGVTFWDSADMYGSHAHVRHALRRLDRGRIVITTKTVARTPERAEQDVDRFRRELGVDCLDILLLHCLFDPEWPTTYRPVMDALAYARERGCVRALGVSCHNFGAFQAAAECDWVEVVLARINYGGLHMDAAPDEVVPVLRRMRAAGKGVYGMKVMGRGDLGHDPERAFRYVFALDVVEAVTIGMRSREEVCQNAALVQAVCRDLAVSPPGGASRR